MQFKLQFDYKNQSGIIVMTNLEPGMEQNKSLVGEIIRFVVDGGIYHIKSLSLKNHKLSIHLY